MSLLFKSRGLGDTPTNIVPNRAVSQIAGTVPVDENSALRSSAVWACLRLRAKLESTTPVDVFRRSAGVQFEMPKPNIVSNPGSTSRMLRNAWMYASRFDLDRYGNSLGYISSRDGLGFPRTVDLWDAGAVGYVTPPGDFSQVTGYRYRGQRYSPDEVWHEKQYPVAGLGWGLSPVQHAAWSIGGYLSAQQFALSWFGHGAFPSGILKNVDEDNISDSARESAKRRFAASVANHDIVVLGAEWEYTMTNVDSQTAGFLDEMKYGIADIARFFDVPGDLIGAETSTGSITYANVSQRMLQYLITSQGPAYIEREEALSAAIPSRQYVKFNTDALLRMDLETKSRIMNGQVMARTRAPSEVRALDNLEPFTSAQIAEFDLLAVPLAKPKTQGVTE